MIREYEGVSLLLTGLGLFGALGLVYASGTAGTATEALAAPMCESKTHKQHNQKYHRSDVVFH